MFGLWHCVCRDVRIALVVYKGVHLLRFMFLLHETTCYR
jgi:hypothetical protein